MTHKRNKYKSPENIAAVAKPAQDKKSHYAIHNTSYAQRSRKFITTSELLKSFEVDSRHMPLSSEVKSNAIKSTVVDLGSF